MGKKFTTKYTKGKKAFAMIGCSFVSFVFEKSFHVKNGRADKVYFVQLG